MNPYLLIGAGFTHNWGGWLSSEVFDYLLGCPEIRDDPVLKGLMWKNVGKGFEYALAEVQYQAADVASPENKGRLSNMERAVSRMLADLNTSIIGRQIDFDGLPKSEGVTSFLARFNAIFSLNQDLFLEHQYVSNRLGSEYLCTWSGVELPGLERISGPPSQVGAEYWSHAILQPKANGDMTIPGYRQPLYKLHGSSNWRTNAGGNLLVMGGDKKALIKRQPLLAAYADM